MRSESMPFCVTTRSGERTPPPDPRAGRQRLPAARRGDRRPRALGGPPHPCRASRGSLVPRRSAIGPLVRPRPAAGACPRARERARSERGRGVERGADASARLRTSGHGGGATRRRAGRLALARRGRPARADRAARRLGRPASVDSGAVAYEFKLPDLGEGLTEGEVARWLVSEGQEIAEDDPLVEIQTDKTTVEIPSP